MKSKIKTLIVTSILVLQAVPEAKAQRDYVDIFYAGCWTKIVTNQAGGMGNQANNVRAGIANSNNGMDASGPVRVRLRIAGYAEFGSFNEGARTVGAALGDFRRRRGVIGRTHRNETQAGFENRLRIDFMQLMIRSNASGNNGEATPDTGYSCIKHRRERQPTLPHELGHNLSALHSHAQGLPGGRVTLLGSRGRGYGTVINRFSNPNLNYNGARGGAPRSRENAIRMWRVRVNRSRIR